MASVSRRAFLEGGLAAIGFAGCSSFDPRGDAEKLLIATAWDEPERELVARSWSRRIAEAGERVRAIWERVGPYDDPVKAVDRIAPDLLLGFSDSAIEKLAHAGKLVVEADGSIKTAIVRRVPLGIVSRTDLAQSLGISSIDRPRDLADPRLIDRVDFLDPREDLCAFIWNKSIFDQELSSAGYAELVRIAGNSAPIPRRASSRSIRLRTGRTVAAAVASGDFTEIADLSFKRSESVEILERAAIPISVRNKIGSREFFRMLEEQGDAIERLDRDELSKACLFNGLLNDLLGSTLIDSADELRRAWRDLHAAGRPERVERFLVEPPPWPPASLLELARKEGVKPGESRLASTLIDQLTDDADRRAWLSEIRDRPRRPIDRSVLNEIVAVDSGRLVTEPRFRGWLRGEWTAWAGQRYRRTARTARGDWPPSPARPGRSRTAG